MYLGSEFSNTKGRETDVERSSPRPEYPLSNTVRLIVVNPTEFWE